MTKILLSAALILVAQGAGAACYALYDSAGKAVYESSMPPFDLSYPGVSAEYWKMHKSGVQLRINLVDQCYGGWVGAGLGAEQSTATQDSTSQEVSWEDARKAFLRQVPVYVDERI
jgi:hypothetical protein